MAAVCHLEFLIFARLDIESYVIPHFFDKFEYTNFIGLIIFMIKRHLGVKRAWLKRGALPMSQPAVPFRIPLSAGFSEKYPIPLGAGFSEKYHVSPLSILGHC